MSARFSRGSSVLAALVLAAFVGGLILSIHQIAQNSPSQAAASNAAGTTLYDTSSPAADTSSSGGQCTEQDVPKACAAAIAQAKTTGKVVSQGSSPVKVDCVAAVKTTDPAYKSSNGYKCVGKSVQTFIKDDGTITINWESNQNVPPGTCKVIACKKNTFTTATCSPIESKCMDKTAAVAALANEATSFTATRSPGGLIPGIIKPDGVDYLTPDRTLSPSENDILNQALGKDPNTNGSSQSIPLDANGNIVSPGYQQLQQLASNNPDQSALDASKQTTAAALQLNQDLSSSQKQDISVLNPPENPDASQWVQQGNGQWCDQYGNCKTQQNQPTEDLAPKQPAGQGPCPSGTTGYFPDCKPVAQQPPCPTCSNTGFNGGPAGNGNGGGGLSNGFLGGLAKALLGGFVQGLHQMLNQPPQMACTSDPNAYNQALQQYQQQMQQYNQQLQQYNYQSQIASYQGYPPPPQPQPPSQPCYSAANNGGNPGPTGTPTAQISCAPQTADVGQSIAISFSCGNASGSAGSGFDTGNQLSGSASTTISNPPAGATAATYSLQCRNSSAIAQAQCSVQITRPSIILVANPKVVAVNASSTIGWVTTGMQSCVISSPDSQQFTAQNAANTSVNGVATTPPLASSANFVLNCTTIGGLTKAATTTVQVGAPGSAAQGAIAVTSSADGASISRGDTVNIAWSSSNPPSGSQIQLWLFDAGLQTEIALIQSDLSASSTYSWVTPAASSTCAGNSPYVCGSDLVPGRSYAIEADLFTGASTSPTYIDYGFTPQNFSVSQ